MTLAMAPRANGFISLSFDSSTVKARYQYIVLLGLREGEVMRVKSPATGPGVQQCVSGGVQARV